MGITQAAPVTVNPDVAAALAFLVQPTTTERNLPITPAVQAEIQDQYGNGVTGATDDVTVDIGTNPAGGTLSGTTTVAAVNGVATFPGLSIDNVGVGYTLTAAAQGLTGATSNSFNITQGTPSASLSTVSASPTTITASTGTSTSTITVTANDANGNPISGATVVLAATGSGNALTQPAGLTDANGMATGTLSSTVAEDKTVSATIDGVAITQTATVTVSAALPSAGQSLVSADPSTILVGSGVSNITVTVKDDFDNPVSGATVALAATGSGNTLTDPAGPTDANGVAVGTLSSTVAELKTVSATAGGVPHRQTSPTRCWRLAQTRSTRRSTRPQASPRHPIHSSRSPWWGIGHMVPIPARR